jgi:hypothetical protein
MQRESEDAYKVLWHQPASVQCQELIVTMHSAHIFAAALLLASAALAVSIPFFLSSAFYFAFKIINNIKKTT